MPCAFLGGLLDSILNIPALIVDALVDVFNAFIEAIAALAASFLNLLPSFPEAPEPPDDGVLGFLTWLVPLGGLLVTFAALMTCWTGFLGIRIILRWVKAL